MGYGWYLDGKLEKRINTFNDFVDCARGLIQAGVAAPGRPDIQGGSAGGDLMGSVVNDAPDLWGGGVADVPFVDGCRTIRATLLPLPPGAAHLWCNPINPQES